MTGARMIRFPSRRRDERLSADQLTAMKASNLVEERIEARVRPGRPNARGVRAGPCLCEPKRGKSPLWVNAHTQKWGCLRALGCGGDIFDYLARFEGYDF